MKRAMKFFARLYPSSWRARYAAEFDALLDDISPSLGDLFDVLADVLRVRLTTSIDTCLAAVPASATALRLPVIVSVSVHGLMITLVLLAVWGRVATMSLHVPPPLPPPFPDPPPQVTDVRVFPNALTLYSSLPLKMPAQSHSLTLYVAEGVGINFLSLPDIGATYRRWNAEWRVWPGQALESFIVRRVLPEYPPGTTTRGAVSVVVEYLIKRDGSVKVLRISGPPPFAGAARSAIQRWLYQPLEFENRPCEVVSRVEVGFNSEYATTGVSR